MAAQLHCPGARGGRWGRPPQLGMLKLFFFSRFRSVTISASLLHREKKKIPRPTSHPQAEPEPEPEPAPAPSLSPAGTQVEPSPSPAPAQPQPQPEPGSSPSPAPSPAHPARRGSHGGPRVRGRPGSARAELAAPPPRVPALPQGTAAARRVGKDRTAGPGGCGSRARGSRDLSGLCRTDLPRAAPLCG